MTDKKVEVGKKMKFGIYYIITSTFPPHHGNERHAEYTYGNHLCWVNYFLNFITNVRMLYS